MGTNMCQPNTFKHDEKNRRHRYQKISTAFILNSSPGLDGINLQMFERSSELWVFPDTAADQGTFFVYLMFQQHLLRVMRAYDFRRERLGGKARNMIGVGVREQMESGRRGKER